uniref:Uncharacterized protein n=1 Tax=Triticum urartu TaxID=4572 RepID=A0A8R7K1B0_TRIUA
YRKDSSPSIEIPDQIGSWRPAAGGATTGCRPAVLLTGQAAFAVRSRCPPASTVWAGAPPFRRSAIESCVRSAASPRRPRLCALPCSLLAQAAGALRRYLPAPHTRAMDKLSPVGNNCISSATSSVSPLYVSLHASSPSTKPRRNVGHQPKATSQES